MKIAISMGAILLGIFTLAGGQQQQSVDDDRSSCKMVQGALEASNAVKLGTTRRVLQEDWEIRSGPSNRWESHYLYRKCSYIQLDVKFVAASRGSAIDLDEVAEISRPYLAYPAKN